MDSKTGNKKYLIGFWSIFAFPFVLVILIFILISFEKLGPMPSFAELENPEFTWQQRSILKMRSFWARLALKTEPGLNIKICRHTLLPRSLQRKISGIPPFGDRCPWYRKSCFPDYAARTEYWRGKYNNPAAFQAALSQRHCRSLNIGQEDQAWSFKIQGMADSRQAGKSYTKEEIIAMYLNKYDLITRQLV